MVIEPKPLNLQFTVSTHLCAPRETKYINKYSQIPHYTPSNRLYIVLKAYILINTVGQQYRIISLAIDSIYILSSKHLYTTGRFIRISKTIVSVVSDRSLGHCFLAII